MYWWDVWLEKLHAASNESLQDCLPFISPHHIAIAIPSGLLCSVKILMIFCTTALPCKSKSVKRTYHCSVEGGIQTKVCQGSLIADKVDSCEQVTVDLHRAISLRLSMTYFSRNSWLLQKRPIQTNQVSIAIADG